MEIELFPAVSLLPETFSVLVAPVDMMAGAINSHPELQRYKILFISGNYSRILSRLNCNITELDVRRAFTSFQLMTILDDRRNNFSTPQFLENIRKVYMRKIMNIRIVVEPNMIGAWI
jgi:DNA polymerase I